MDDFREAVNRRLIQGCCCSEALIRAGLELLGEEENTRLIDASSGLCNGMFSGGACGALTAGCMFLSMTDRESGPELCQRLYEWFDLTYGSVYGSVSCEDILGDDPFRRIERCQPLILDTADKCMELLEDEGIL